MRSMLTAMERPTDRLYAATEASRDHVAALAYTQAASSGTLPMDRYASFLRAVHTLHKGLEQAIELSGDAALRAAVGDTFVARRRLLEGDLSHLAIDPQEVDAPVLAALVLTQRMRLAAQRDVPLLYGHAYALDQLHVLAPSPALAARPALLEGGLAFVRALRRPSHEDGPLQGRLDAALADDAVYERARVGAEDAWTGLAALADALSPGPEPRWMVSELNPHAGTHAVPSDLREVEAALLAGEDTWRRFSYYEARYGERGRHFTRSDSAWLATLAREDAPQAVEHVRWLARVLAARGMPRLLLELHLQQLHDTLVARVPERRDCYRGLLLAAEQLRDEREGVLHAARVEALLHAHGPTLHDEMGIAPAEAATLAIAAVADEKHGIAQAVPSLMSWLGDASRFSPAWVAALQRTLIAARSPA